jgi:hypothetical protein
MDGDVLEAVPGPVALREPSRTGTLRGAERKHLFRLFQHVGARWEMAASGVGEAEFSDLVDSKSSIQPSYFTEYKEAAVLVGRASADDDPNSSMDALLLPRPEVANMAATRLGRFQKYVGNEFITWYLTRGGFRRFGYEDYRGYGGGSFMDHSRLPYRAFDRDDR